MKRAEAINGCGLLFARSFESENTSHVEDDKNGTDIDWYRPWLLCRVG